MTFFVGGEFWEDLHFENSQTTIPPEGMTLLNGGEGAIRLTCDILASRKIHDLLVPEYICSTMADAFDRYGIRTTFYRIDPNFRIDLEDLEKKAAEFQSVYSLNYFGYGFTQSEKQAFQRLQELGKLLIEDDAQSMFSRDSRADIRFNTLRKFVPHDGSFFYSNFDLSPYLEKFIGLLNRRLPVIRKFRQEFARLINEGADSFDEINPLFDLSEKYYYEDLTVLGDPQEGSAAIKLDWAELESRRKANHQRLMERLADLEGIQIIFPQVCRDSIPLGFPIYVKNGRRDALLQHLREENVYPVVHWNILDDPRLNQRHNNVEKLNNIMTLILDQRFDEEDMDYEASLLRTFFW